MTGSEDPRKAHEQRVLFSLLLGGLILSAVAMVREGPHYDNVIDGWRFFTMAFFTGTLTGFIGWIKLSGAEPKFSLSGAHRHPWLAALVAGLVFATAASFINRTFATPTGRTIIADVDRVEDGRGDRWHVSVKFTDGTYHRYLVPDQAAAALKTANAVQLKTSRGLLGYEIVAGFEPVAR